MYCLKHQAVNQKRLLIATNKKYINNIQQKLHMVINIE